MAKEFNNKVTNVGTKSLDTIEMFMNGDGAYDSQKIKTAMQMVGFSIRVRDSERLERQHKESVGLRLMQFIPKEKRTEYIKITNPELGPLLLNRPKK